MIRHQNDLFKEFSFPSAAALGPGSALCCEAAEKLANWAARPAAESAIAREGETCPSPTSMILPAGRRPMTSTLPVLQGGRMMHLETVARQLWPLPSLFALSLLRLESLRTAPARTTCPSPCPPSPWHSTLPARLIQSRGPDEKHRRGALTTAPNTENSSPRSAQKGLLCNILQRYRD